MNPGDILYFFVFLPENGVNCTRWFSLRVATRGACVYAPGWKFLLGVYALRAWNRGQPLEPALGNSSEGKRAKEFECFWPLPNRGAAFFDGMFPGVALGDEFLQVRVNGEDRELDAGATIAALLESMSLEVNGIAVALNMEIVRRGEYGDTHLSDGDEVEIVRAVGGG